MVVILVSIPQITLAAAACWQQEVNPQTKQRYTSQQQYQTHLNQWNARMPIIPNPLNLLNAYNLYKSELPNLKNLSNDKVKHCYIGCRVAQATSQNTANYMGWYKELQDLTDCKPNTHFENQDYIATVQGARIQTKSKSVCVSACEQTWNPR